LEAMATGLPVVASNIPGNQAVIEDGMNGLLFAAGDPVDLENKLTNLLSDRSQRQRLGEAAAISVDSHFSIAAIADHYIETYKQLLTESK